MNINELKAECKRLGIRHYSNKKKSETEQLIEAHRMHQKDIKKAVERALVMGDKKYVILRGGAIHVDFCPLPARVWNGKPYANVIDDCAYCKYQLAQSEHLGNYDYPEQFIICGGHSQFKCEGPMPVAIPFDEKDFIIKCLYREKAVFKCEECDFMKDVPIYEAVHKTMCPHCETLMIEINVPKRFSDKELWVVRIASYRKWTIRVYFELYKGNSFFRDVYYDVVNKQWVYNQGDEGNKVNFEELEQHVLPYLRMECMRLVDPAREYDFIMNATFEKLINYSDYKLYLKHPEYRSKYNILHENRRRREY